MSQIFYILKMELLRPILKYLKIIAHYQHLIIRISNGEIILPLSLSFIFLHQGVVILVNVLFVLIFTDIQNIR